MSFLKQNDTVRPQATKSTIALTGPTFCLCWVNDIHGLGYEVISTQVLTNAAVPDGKEKSIMLQSLFVLCGCLLPFLFT